MAQKIVISGCTVTAEEKERIYKIANELGFAPVTGFVKTLLMSFVEQVESGQTPDWPPKFVLRPGVRQLNERNERNAA